MGYYKIKNIVENIKWFTRSKNVSLQVPKRFKTEKQKTNFIRKTEIFLNEIIEIEYDR